MSGPRIQASVFKPHLVSANQVLAETSCRGRSQSSLISLRTHFKMLRRAFLACLVGALFLQLVLAACKPVLHDSSEAAVLTFGHSAHVILQVRLRQEQHHHRPQWPGAAIQHRISKAFAPRRKR